MKFLTLTVLCVLPALVSACSPDSSVKAGQVFRFSAIPSEKSVEMTAEFDRVATYLTEHLGVRVEYVPVVSYPGSVEAFKNGDVQLAWFGGVTGVQARIAVPGANAIAQGKVDPQYKSYFIANASTGLTYSEDFPAGIEGMTFAFGSRDSTSGRVMPTHFITQATGLTPLDFLGDTEFTGAHDRTAQQVQDGVRQAGALSYKTYEKLVASGKIDPEVCVKIWQTPPYPDYQWTLRPDLDEVYGEGFSQRVQDVLVAIKDPEVLAALQREEGMIPAKNADFEPIRMVGIQVGIIEE
jgi:phosphonate transport system substrate-binding protein